MKLSTRHIAPGLLGLAVLLAFGYTLPQASRNPVIETAAWGLVVVTSFVGYGSLLRELVLPKAPLDLGLRAAWGAGFACVLGGLLAAFSAMTRPSALLIVEVGVVLSLIALYRQRDAVARTARLYLTVGRREPLMALAGLFIVAVLAVHYVGAICEWHTNPYDDDIAYLAFVKKLNDTGTLVEPFSFRRLGALGGQTFFLLLVSPRAAMSQAHTFDRGICVLMVVFLIFGHRTKGRRPPLVLLFMTTAFFLTLPNIAINTASYYSGVVFFFALYRTLMHYARFPVASPVRAALPLALLGATACTLRQNYLPVPVVLLGASYAFFWTEAPGDWKRKLQEPLWTCGLTLACIAPWFYVAYRSNQTFLFPIMAGNSNPSLALQSSGMTWVKELTMQARVAIEAGPLRVMPLLFFAVLLQREKTARKPMWAMLAAAVLGTMAVTHGFSQSDPPSIARYIFAGTMSLALAIVLTAGTDAAFHWKRGIRFVSAGALVLVAVCIQLIQPPEKLSEIYVRFLRNIDNVRSEAERSVATLRGEVPLYMRLQEAVPANQRFAVMLDEPYYLDFSRNEIFNLDMPGYASLGGNEPFFLGSQKVADYFLAAGIRYIAFVRPDHSRYHFRREYWVERIVDEEELWRLHAPYLIDFVDSLTELSKTRKVLFEERGLVVIDLGGEHAS